MANKALFMGKSGTGKTYSLINMDPKKTFYINADEKHMPFRGWKKKFKTVYKDDGKVDMQKSNYFRSNKPDKIQKVLMYINKNCPHIKYVFIDTITLMMTDMFMSRITEKGFDKFSEQADDTYQLIKSIDSMRDDLFVGIMAHTETENEETQFFVPGGKLLKEKVKVESLFTIVLQTIVEYGDEESKYYFLTENNGSNTVKSPKGMFPGKYIDNDMAAVVDYIEKWENGEELTEEDKSKAQTAEVI